MHLKVSEALDVFPLLRLASNELFARGEGELSSLGYSRVAGARDWFPSPVACVGT